MSPNKLILILGILFLLPSVMAGNENGKITAGKDLWIIDMDVKVDERSSRNLEYGNEITRDANPNSIIKFYIRIKNNHTGITMEDVFIIVEIDDLDLEVTSDEFDISTSDDKKFNLELTLPSDAEDGSYEICIEVEGELNNSIHRVEYELELNVEVEEVASPSTLTQKIDNLISNVSELNKDVGSFFNPYAECTSERDSCKTTIEMKDKEIATMGDYKIKFETCNNRIMDIQNQMTELRVSTKLCSYNITHIQIPAVKEAEAKNSQKWLWAFIPSLLILLYYNKEKLRLNPSGEAEEEKEDGEVN